MHAVFWWDRGNSQETATWKPGKICEDESKINLREIDREDSRWVELVQDRAQ
jgi:hypothetical protein